VRLPSIFCAPARRGRTLNDPMIQEKGAHLSELRMLMAIDFCQKCIGKGSTVIERQIAVQGPFHPQRARSLIEQVLVAGGRPLRVTRIGALLLVRKTNPFQ